MAISNAGLKEKFKGRSLQVARNLYISWIILTNIKMARLGSGLAESFGFLTPHYS